MPRPRNPKGVGPRVKDARAYNAALRQAYLEPFLNGMRGRLAVAASVNQAYYALQAGLQAIEAQPVFGIPVVLVENSLQAVRAYNRERLFRTFRTALGVDIRPLLTEAAVQAHMTEAIRVNTDLVRTIPKRFHDKLRQRIAEEFAAAPFDQQRLMQMFNREYGSTNYNLRRITRDQTSKLNGQLNEQRQRQLGVTHYIWRTSEDERVRPTHSDKNGRTFAWASPPPDTGPPSADVQCRCISEPIIMPDNRQRLGA